MKAKKTELIDIERSMSSEDVLKVCYHNMEAIVYRVEEVYGLSPQDYMQALHMNKVESAEFIKTDYVLPFDAGVIMKTLDNFNYITLCASPDALALHLEVLLGGVDSSGSPDDRFQNLVEEAAGVLLRHMSGGDAERSAEFWEAFTDHLRGRTADFVKHSDSLPGCLIFGGVMRLFLEQVTLRMVIEKERVKSRIDAREGSVENVIGPDAIDVNSSLEVAENQSRTNIQLSLEMIGMLDNSRPGELDRITQGGLDTMKEIKPKGNLSTNHKIRRYVSNLEKIVDKLGGLSVKALAAALNGISDATSPMADDVAELVKLRVEIVRDGFGGELSRHYIIHITNKAEAGGGLRNYLLMALMDMYVGDALSLMYMSQKEESKGFVQRLFEAPLKLVRRIFK